MLRSMQSMVVKAWPTTVVQTFDRFDIAMKTLPLTEAKAQLSRLLADVERRDERVTITRHGRPVAVVLSQSDLEGLEATLEIMSDPEFYGEVLRGKREVESGRAVFYGEDEVFGASEAPHASSRRQATRRRGDKRRRGRSKPG